MLKNLKDQSRRIKKRLAKRKAQKQKVKFERVKEFGNLCVYIPKNRKEALVFQFVGQGHKNAKPILVDRMSFIEFLVLPGDIKRAKKEIEKTKKTTKDVRKSMIKMDMKPTQNK